MVRSVFPRRTYKEEPQRKATLGRRPRAGVGRLWKLRLEE